jgi:hypothetical protein
MKHEIFKSKLTFKNSWDIIEELDWSNHDKASSECGEYLFNNYTVHTVDNLVNFINQRIKELNDFLNSQDMTETRFGPSDYDFIDAIKFVIFSGKETFELVKGDVTYFEDIILKSKYRPDSGSIVYHFYTLYEESLVKYDLENEVEEVEYEDWNDIEEYTIEPIGEPTRELNYYPQTIGNFNDYIRRGGGSIEF